MRVSIIIPVWNGAAVIAECLKALFECGGSNLLEVICVDNASTDESPMIIAKAFPQVQLLRQSINLGFAGGVNAGIAIAKGDVFILLNQDCIVQPGWLISLLQVLESTQEAILGCMILNPDGSVDHLGAKIQRPEAIGVHLKRAENNEESFPVEYVSGAVFVIPRKVWEKVGKFDEGFYPAYYEDADYCFRARRYGINVLCVPQARVIHLRSSTDWQMNPFLYRVNHHTVRYRFACKHFPEHELSQFFEAERARINNSSLEEILERVIAVRRSLFRLSEIVARRQSDLAEEVSFALVRRMQAGLGTLLREAVARLKPESFNFPSMQDLSASFQELRSLQQREYALLQRIYFRSPLDKSPEPRLRRFLRLFVLRPLSFIVGRDYLLLAELNALHVARMDQMDQMINHIAQAMNSLRQHIEIWEMIKQYEG